MGTVKGFWQHINGRIYAIESTPFGEILGGAGPLETDEIRDLNEYEYKPAILEWLQRALAEGKLHRISIPGRG